MDIEDDILRAAKELAANEGITAGAIISRLAREGLRQPVTSSAEPALKNGVPVFPARAGEIITIERVRDIMNEEAI